MALSLSSKLLPAEDVAFREISRQGVLLDLESGTYYGLNGVGARAWALLLDGCDLAEIHRRLLTEYDVDAVVLEQDLLAWGDQLLRNGLVQQG